MTLTHHGVVATAAVAPLVASATVRAEQVSQLVLGETGELLGRAGEWLHVRTATDGYEGWVNQGYVRGLPSRDAAEWRAAATAWSEGARVSVGDTVVAVPLRGRVAVDDSLVLLPDGRAGRLIDGTVTDAARLAAGAAGVPAEEWALDHFRGAPYQWGGLTPWGVDCSGLVQTTFLARGIVLPRDSSKQAEAGEPVEMDRIAPGDLLFFRSESGPHITHVAFAAVGDTIVHSTIACGGVLRESFAPGSRAGDAIRPRLTAVRRVASRS